MQAKICYMNNMVIVLVVAARVKAGQFGSCKSAKCYIEYSYYESAWTYLL